MKKHFLFSTLFPVVLAIFVSVFFVPFACSNSITSSGIPFVIDDNPKDFMWPTPSYKNVTSPFGYRKSPATGASTYHGGIDIGAPQGSKIFATLSGKVIYTGFKGANGYTVIIKHDNNYESTYGHVSPNFVVEVGDYVEKGDHIANVGPKYIDKKSFTTYKDSTGQYTNGATTGPHLHFAISLNGKRIDPATLF